MGIKAHDCFVAALCQTHHYNIDQGKDLTKGEREELWTMAHRKTLLELFRRGLIQPS
jgi:hypothetical protein